MRVLKSRWFQIFVSGILLLYLLERTLVGTANPIYFPSVIMLGAFLVPVSFTTYLYDRIEWEVPFPAIAVCFLWGGAIGTVIAGTLEYNVLRSLGVFALLGVGLIEESAKLIFPLFFYFLGRYRSESAGIVLGVATAMGFAALETMGYGFVTLLQSRGNLVALDEILLVRGLMSPAGHAAWTGLVCAALWHERLRVGRITINARVIGAFAAAIGLHALWDTFNSLHGPTLISFLSIEALSLAVALLSLILLIRRIRRAGKTLPPQGRVN